VAGCSECGDEPSGSCATELVIVPVVDTVALNNCKLDVRLLITCGICEC
jgi:hypothetical protein